jgi:hypothetical protein
MRGRDKTGVTRDSGSGSGVTPALRLHVTPAPEPESLQQMGRAMRQVTERTKP